MAAASSACVVTVDRRRSIADVGRRTDADLLGLPECDGLSRRKPFLKPLESGFPGCKFAGMDCLPDQAEINILYLMYRPS